MLRKKIYDENTHTQKAWYDSTMIFYTEMVEYDSENKGDLYVTFKNGATYKYIGVKFEDYVVFVGGGTDDSHGKTLNKLIKGKYDFERVSDKNINDLENEFQKLSKKENEKWNTFFISGHRDISEEEFENNYKPAILHVLNEFATCKFVIGDCIGVDKMAQDFLIDALEVDPDRITVYHMLEKPRNINPKIINLSGGYKSDIERDSAMTEVSCEDIAFVRDNTKNSGTAQNILRRYLLK